MKRAVPIAFVLLMSAALAPSAGAQVTLDVTKITCEQFVLYKLTNPQFIAMWLSGYYNAKRNNTLLDPQTLERNADKVRDYCRRNMAMPVMQATETALGASD
jgi:acid stress chaperone HdeB